MFLSSIRPEGVLDQRLNRNHTFVVTDQRSSVVVLKRNDPVPDSDRQAQLQQVFPPQQKEIIHSNLLPKKLVPVLVAHAYLYEDVLEHLLFPARRLQAIIVISIHLIFCVLFSSGELMVFFAFRVRSVVFNYFHFLVGLGHVLIEVESFVAIFKGWLALLPIVIGC